MLSFITFTKNSGRRLGFLLDVDGFVEFRYNVAVDGSASAHGIGKLVIKVRSMRLSTLIRESLKTEEST